jgi:hypothetical protein
VQFVFVTPSTTPFFIIPLANLLITGTAACASTQDLGLKKKAPGTGGLMNRSQDGGASEPTPNFDVLSGTFKVHTSTSFKGC